MNSRPSTHPSYRDCLERRVGFTEIDLRWGITEEESKNGATVEICLKEIDRCRDFPPFFIGFLGERYGWIPKHDELAAFWEKHNDSPYAKIIGDSIERGISVTELEMELAVLATGAADKLHSRAQFFLRDRKLTDELYRQEKQREPDPVDASYYDPADGRLEKLKDRIRKTPFMGIVGYTTVEQFGDAIEKYLLDELDRNFPAEHVPSAFEQSNLAHAAFRYHRLTNFLPRDDVRKNVVEALKKHTDQPALGCILLTGPSGQGKSALMADMVAGINGLTDFRVIDYGSATFMPQDSVELNKRDVEWLESKLKQPFSGKTVVVTHHLPSGNSVAERYKKSLLTACFASDFERLMGYSDIWIHGHTHDSSDYVLNGTRVICNPRGYCKPGNPPENPDFNPMLVVEI